MENRKAAPAPRSPLARDRSRLVPSFYFPFSIFILASLLSGCASPGEPTERKASVPAAVADLAAVRWGDDVILTFTPPKETAEHKPLKEIPTIEIYRDFEPTLAASGAASPAPPASPSLLVTIPPAMVDQYMEKGQIRYVDSLAAGNFAAHPDSVGVYVVRTRTSVKRESENSNAADVPIEPALEPIADLKAAIEHSAVELAWTAPQKTAIGTVPAVAGYRIYRAEAEPGPAASGAVPGAPAPDASREDLVLKLHLAKVGETQSTAFEDTGAELGYTYTYSVRSAADYPGGTIESADSNLAIVTVRDVTPPAAPLELIAAWVPAQDGIPAHAELSWAISPESNIAGYNVYRSGEAGVPGTRLNPTPLPSPAFRDMNATPGERYYYSVTAVDRSGNESPASAAVSCGPPGESQPAP